MILEGLGEDFGVWAKKIEPGEGGSSGWGLPMGSKFLQMLDGFSALTKSWFLPARVAW